MELANVLSRVPAKPARTFREALQSIHLFLYSLFGIYSAGRPDQYQYPYYENDIKEGVMTEVFVNDPTRGYGIFIENMLNAAG